MDRDLYKKPFTKSDLPAWKCPTCENGNLRIKKRSFVKEETSSSAKSHGEMWFDYSFVAYVYSCLFECTNSTCEEVIASSGEGFVSPYMDEDHEGNPIEDYMDFFRPNYFYPHLKLFATPKDVPEDVVKEIELSFELFFCNPPSSLNHIRIALEYLLTHMRVNRYRMVRRRRKSIVLHERINLIPEKFREIKDHCLAIKWSGNAGSHSGEGITKDDVMDAYEIMNEILREIFKGKKKEIKKLVKQINKKKGPKGKKKIKKRKSVF